jgi:hypothetical protein
MDPSLRAMAEGRAVYLEDGREQPFGAPRARPGLRG